MATAQSLYVLKDAPIHRQSLRACHLAGSWATIGIYDGVHRGHQAIIQALVTGAHTHNLPAVVITFHPHPAVVLGAQNDFKLLTLPEERARLLHTLGVDCVITLPFTPQLAQTAAAQFMQQVKEQLGVRHLIIGYDFALGRNREGDAQHLQKLGKTLGYTLTHIPAIQDGNAIISSSRIRQTLRRGAVQEAAALLGRPYALRGEVVHGDGRGRTIHIPTANIHPAPEKLIPANGVYAGYILLNGQRHPAVTNIGLRPTFGQQTRVHIEAHILDFQGDLYGQTLGFEFIARLRAEKKFSHLDALIAQIHADIAAARKILPVRREPAKETGRSSGG